MAVKVRLVQVLLPDSTVGYEMIELIEFIGEVIVVCVILDLYVTWRLRK